MTPPMRVDIELTQEQIEELLCKTLKIPNSVEFEWSTPSNLWGCRIRTNAVLNVKDSTLIFVSDPRTPDEF